MSKQSDPSFIVALTALVLGAVAMAISPVFIRIASLEVGPFASAFWRVFLAIPLLYAWARVEEKYKNPVRLQSTPLWRRQFHKYAVFAGLAFAGDLFFWHLAVMRTSIANAIFLATMTPVFILFFNWLFYRLFPEKQSVTGVMVCLMGGGVLVGGSLNLGFHTLTGDSFSLITAFFFSLYFMAVQAARKDAGAALITYQLTIVTALCLFFIACFDTVYNNTAFLPTSLQGVGALFGMAIISQVAGQGFMAIALGRLPSVFSSLVIFLEAVAATFFGWIFLNEVVSFQQIIGGLLILFGIWIARPKHRQTAIDESKKPYKKEF